MRVDSTLLIFGTLSGASAEEEEEDGEDEEDEEEEEDILRSAVFMREVTASNIRSAEEGEMLLRGVMGISPGP